MSSRALRKAQRELEQKKQLEKLEDEASEEVSEDEVDDTPVPTKGASMFALLGAEEDQDEDPEDEDPIIEPSQPLDQESHPQEPSKPSRKKKNKKKAKRAKEPESELKQRSHPESKDELDEIDIALRSLSTKDDQSTQDGPNEESNNASADDIELYSLLAVDTSHLQAANEMRKLFGRAALDRDEDEGEGAARRRGGRQQVGIAGAVAGRNASGGRNLASLGLRRNVFVQGKEEWPRATTGGLGMEVVEKRKDGTVEYKFVHNSAYQSVQRQFQECVASMDPNRMVQLLQYNPFHISTVLQVSEIAKHERDRATSGDLLERALFAFGRAVHSTFAGNLSNGKARLDFRRPENREFWLAAWRYVAMLGQRATWRTAFEWTQLLLSLDPVRDPYCISLTIDQLALRGRQPQKLIDLWNSKHFHSEWHRLSNVSMSVGLAYAQTGEPQLARSFLKDAIEQYPWVAMRLFQELELQPIPPSIWGKQPRSDTENIFTELYVTKAKDIWNTPEATALLMEVASTAQPKSPADVSIYTSLDELNYTRQIILTDDQNLIGMLDRSITARLSSVSDPLPPKDNLPSYSTDTPRLRAAPGSALSSAQDMVAELSALQSFFERILPWFPQAGGGGGPEAALNPETGERPTAADLGRRLEESGVDPQTILERAERMQQLQLGIQNLIDDTEMRVGEALGVNLQRGEAGGADDVGEEGDADDLDNPGNAGHT